MGFAGGDPGALSSAAQDLEHLSSDLARDAVEVARYGRSAAADAGDAQVAELAETALAAIGGVLVGTSTIVEGLAQGSTTAGTQLRRATGVPQ
ncbi:hypothetical protein [Cellulomonas sp. HZM]|uniref:hypothetical protein n=1 Tax=Cellulomonas sp. HZM TaxID=1454010 RepID=UPI0004935569|nr:hypothetical protein [Cellulomonas sp. HZM]